METPVRIKVHSFSDVITNSSTVIYVQTHGKSIKVLEDFVDFLLKKSGSTHKAKDLFDFKIEPSEDFLKDVVYERMDEQALILDETKKKVKALETQKKYKEADDLRLKTVREKLNNNEYSIDEDQSEDEGRFESSLLLIPKSSEKEVKNITTLVREMFEIIESNDG
jgi:hypothetical protein